MSYLLKCSENLAKSGTRPGVEDLLDPVLTEGLQLAGCVISLNFVISMRYEEKSGTSRHKRNQISPHSSFEMTKYRVIAQSADCKPIF